MLHLMAKHMDRAGKVGIDQVVLGRVALSGKVIEHDFGYRAERARIAELIPFRGAERSVMVLRTTRGRDGARVDPTLRRGSPRSLDRRLPPAHALAPRKARPGSH